MAEPIALGEPIETTNKEGKKLLVFSPEDSTKIAEVEARSTAVMLTVGSKGGTHTIDHLLRLPGTVNYPNASKREKGRSIMLSALLELNDNASALTDFPELDFPPTTTRASPWSTIVDVPEELQEAVDTSTGKGVSTAPGDLIDGGLAGILAALAAINPDIQRREWVAVGCGLYKLLGAEKGFEFWDEWSCHGQKYHSREMNGQWRSIVNGGGYGWNIGTLMFYANEADAKWRDHIGDWRDKLAVKVEPPIEAPQESSLILTHEQKADVSHQLVELYNGPEAEAKTGTIEEEPKPLPAPSPPRKGWIKTSADFVAGFTPPDYLIYGLLLRAFVYSMTGMTGAGKTSICLLIAAYVALGRAIGKLEVERGKVLYLVGENADDVCMRWIKLCEDLKVEPHNVGVCFIDIRLKLSLDTVKTKLGNETVDHGPFVLVIVDTSVAFFEGDNENDNVQALAHAKVMRGLIDMVEGRPTVIVATHPVKNAAADNLLPRGGGSFLNEMDGNLTCRKDDSTGTVELHWQGKFRGPEFAPIPFKLIPGTTEKLKDTKGRLIWTVTAAPIDQAEKTKMEATAEGKADALLILLNKETNLSQLQMAERLGWFYKTGGGNKTAVERMLNKLKAEKLVEHQGRCWLLTKNGKAAATRAEAERDRM